MSNNAKDSLYFFCGALLGGAIGATAALLLSPSLRKETKQRLQHLGLNGKTIRKWQRHAVELTHRSKPKKHTQRGSVKINGAALSRKKVKKSLKKVIGH